MDEWIKGQMNSFIIMGILNLYVSHNIQDGFLRIFEFDSMELVGTAR